MSKAKNIFIQPRRRSVKQRSGFKVSGTKTGSECMIFETVRFLVKGKRLSFNYKEKAVKFSKLFSEGIFIYGVGGYIKSQKAVMLTGSIKILKDNKDEKVITKKIIPAKKWVKFGFDLETSNLQSNLLYDVVLELDFKSKHNNFEIEIFGLQAGAVNYYAEREIHQDTYHEKIDLYKPEIYYLPYKEIKYFKIKNAKTLPKGVLIGKSCNRCARFLPIDVESELNPLGFSNHCKKKPPCKHRAFSKYKITNPSLISNLPEQYVDKIATVSGQKLFTTYFGFQLECRSCKKFEVNAPLNKLRNKAQHHEDSARRRAFEKMIIELTGNDFVKNYRITHGEEFQDHIWKRFRKRCFLCRKGLNKQKDMDIDHTFPLSYLWPLDDTATALCKTCNSVKSDLFPSELYSKEQLLKLSKLTGIPFKKISSKRRIINQKVLKLLLKNVVWLFDDFLARKDYQKTRKGKKASDLIYKALQKVLQTEDINLVDIYRKEKGNFPKSITIK